MRMLAVAMIMVSLGSLGAWAATPVCAKRMAMLRKSPNAKAPVSWRAAKYMPFLRTDSRSGWAKLEDLDGEIHWAKSSELTTQYRCVVVKTNVATLRSQPSAQAPPVDMVTADRYTPFKRLGNQREWVQIEDESGRRAWIHESQVWKPVIVNAISF
jgi:SH3-like domain-containing protein